MKLVAVQARSVAGDIDGNIERHVRFIEKAASLGAAAVFFPELSLTGYEPRLAQALAMTPDDPRLDVFQRLSEQHDLLIAVGAPYRGRQGTEIGMFVFRAGMPPTMYAKQLLHADELPYFAPGDKTVVFPLGDAVIAPAICYQTLQDVHAHAASMAGATVYLGCVATPARGVEAAYRHYPDIAQRYGLTVMMSNSIGPADDFVMPGGSAAWREDGTLACSVAVGEEAMVVYDLGTREGEVVSCTGGHPA